MHPPGLIPDRTIIAAGHPHITDTLEVPPGMIPGHWLLLQTLTILNLQSPHVLQHSSQDP